MIYAIDASVYVFRAWFSVPDDMVDPAGQPVNALYGFARFLGDFLEQVKPENIVVAFDAALVTSFRNELYPPYKANRDPAPVELKRQFELCRRYTRALGLAEYAHERYEADDIIGTAVHSARRSGQNSTIVSRDKDLAQLLTNDDIFWDYASQRRISYREVPEAFGVWPEQIADFLALAGDTVDNIPGVPGVGKKTAAALLAHFGSFNVLYANLDRVSEVNVRGAGKLGDKLALHKEQAELCRALTEIECAAQIDFDMQSTRRGSPKLGAVSALCDEAGFGALLRRQAQRIADGHPVTGI